MFLCFYIRDGFIWIVGFNIYLILPHIANGTHLITQGYTRFVEVGRVARVAYGPEQGNLATVVDILSDKRVLIDGENIKRQVIPVKRLQLTKQVVKLLRGARSGKVKSIIKKENVAKTFSESSLGKAYARQSRRQSLTDFERHKVLVLRRKLSKLRRAKVSKKKWSSFI